jgi:MFS family permease
MDCSFGHDRVAATLSVLHSGGVRTKVRLARWRRQRGATLLSHTAFRRLWAGQTVSVLGSQVTVVALPLAAVLVLHASTFQVGLLTTAAYAAFIAIGLPAGVWVDRMRRRPVMVAADLLRASVLVSVPVAYALGDPIFRLCGRSLAAMRQDYWRLARCVPPPG